MLRLYPWVDTTGESNVYPIGDAVGVYRAALDLLYNDQGKRPSVIVLHDTAELGADRPCPVQCASAWPHKSKIDTSTMLAFARFSPKRPGIRDFGYPVPIALVSYKDMEQMRYDARAAMAAHNIQNNLSNTDLRYALQTRFPGAWGLTELSKVGFNTRHTEALVQVRNWCGENCASSETLFLKRFGTTWRVIERIPHYAELGPTRGNLRYRGPFGDTPEQSEIIATADATPMRSESRDANAVYRRVLDSLYNFQGESPRQIVVTDRRAWAGDGLPPPKTPLDAGLFQKYLFLRLHPIVPDIHFRYRIPISVVLSDSLARLDRIGATVADPVANESLWFGLKKEFPATWGMLALSRVAFNLTHTQAIVSSSHQCGQSCVAADTWVLTRKGEHWRIVERIGQTGAEDWEPSLFPLRYIGVDAQRNAYRHRHARFVFSNAVTHQRLRFLRVVAEGNPVRHATFVTDRDGTFDLGTVPFFGATRLTAACADQSHADSVWLGDFIFSPGSDTTIRSRVDFRSCLRRSQSHRLTGAQAEFHRLTGTEASISGNEARFVFPVRTASQLWDRPEFRKAPGTTSFSWEVDWGTNPPRETDSAVALWLRFATNGDGQPPTSFSELVRNSHLDVMMYCHSCDEPAIYANPRIDSTNIFATVENGHLVFVVRGMKAMSKIFPQTPKMVTFGVHIVHKPTGKREMEPIGESQVVLVNCRIADSTAYGRRRCDAPTNAQFAKPPIDSTGPRRVTVVAVSYDGGSLVRNTNVRVVSEDRKLPTVTRSTAATGKISLMQASRDSISFQALCPARAGPERVSGELAMYVAPGRDTTIQLIVDPRRCSP